MTVEQARDDMDEMEFQPLGEASAADAVSGAPETNAEIGIVGAEERAAILASVPAVERPDDESSPTQAAPAETEPPRASPAQAELVEASTVSEIAETPAEPVAPESVAQEAVAEEPVAQEAVAEEAATPETVSTPASAAEVAFPDERTEVSIWPFVALDIVWLGFAGFIVWQLTQLPAGVAVYESGIYPLTLLGGLVLTAAGPVMIIVSWFAEKGRLAASSGHAFISALMRGSVATLIGVALWWIALLAVDQIRLGRLF